MRPLLLLITLAGDRRQPLIRQVLDAARRRSD
jgi:hypothetical protein